MAAIRNAAGVPAGEAYAAALEVYRYAKQAHLGDGLDPLLVVALTLWGNATYDRLLITKVRSDLAVAHGYFDRVLNDVGLGTQAVGGSHRLLSTLADR